MCGEVDVRWGGRGGLMCVGRVDVRVGRADACVWGG